MSVISISARMLVTTLLLMTTSLVVMVNGFVVVAPLSSHCQSLIVGEQKQPQLSSPTQTTTTTTKLHMIGDLFSGGGGSGPLLNEKNIKLQESLTANTSLQNKELKCVYNANVDGWSAIDFHTNVDGKGSSLVVIVTRSGKFIGGFNPVGWRSTDDYYDTNSAFLWYSPNGRNGNTIIKCPILTGGK